MATTLVSYDPMAHEDTKKMYNFVYVETWNTYEFLPTNDTVSLDNNTQLYDGTGWNLCGKRLYYTETVTGGIVGHTTVEEEIIHPEVSVRSLTMQFQGEQLVYLKTVLEDYPHIETRQQFKVIFFALLETLPVTEKYH